MPITQARAGLVDACHAPHAAAVGRLTPRRWTSLPRKEDSRPWIASKTLCREGGAHDRAAPRHRARDLDQPRPPDVEELHRAPRRSIPASQSPPSIARSVCLKIQASLSATISATAAPATKKCPISTTTISST